MDGTPPLYAGLAPDGGRLQERSKRLGRIRAPASRPDGRTEDRPLAGSDDNRNHTEFGHGTLFAGQVLGGFMQQALDFLEESEVLFDLVDQLPESDFVRQTQFKRWNINDILVHLHFWNLGADLSLNDPDVFTAMFDDLYGALKAGRLREHENSKVGERGSGLVKVWADQFREMGERWASVDPKTRLKWAGPGMSARTSMSARQMEFGHTVRQFRSDGKRQARKATGSGTS